MDAVTGEMWTINQYGVQGPDQLGKIWIGQPLPVGEDRLVFSGHIANAGKGVPVSLFHGTEALATCTANPGFIVEVPKRKGTYYIEMPVREERGRDVICRWEVVDQERQDMALVGEMPRNLPTASRPELLFGRMGHLFLAGDVDDSVGQFTRNASLPEESRSAWSEFFAQMPNWKQDYGLEKISLLVAPSKEEILRDHYPFRRAANTVFDDFMRHFGDKPVIMPRWELWNRRNLSYQTTGTDWTDCGASTAAQLLLKRWNLPESIPQTFRIERSTGNLGMKLTPPEMSAELVFGDDRSSRLAFDNRMPGQGHIQVYRNSAAPVVGKLVIFGDEQGISLADALSDAFEEVLYAHQPAMLDPALINLVKPTHMLLQIRQRAVYAAPNAGHSIFESGRERLAKMTEQERDQTKARLKTAPAEFQPLVTPLFD